MRICAGCWLAPLRSSVGRFTADYMLAGVDLLLHRIGWRPGLIGGFLVKTGLGLAP
jgi:hypothetical protein